MALTRKQLVLLVILTLCWGANWPIMKLAVSEIPPLHYRAITMGCGAIVLTGWLLYRGFSLRLKRETFFKILLLAFPNAIGWHIFSIWGVAELASGRASILGFTMPVWTVLLSALFLKQRLNIRIIFSIAVVVIAIALLTMNEWSRFDGRIIGVIWMQIAAISWALGIVLLKKIRLDIPIEVTTVWMLMLGTLGIGFIAAFYETSPAWSTYSTQAWFTLFYGALINFVVAQLIWFNMVYTLPPAVSAFSVMSIPLVSIVSGMFLAGETPQIADLIAVACIIAAIANTVLFTGKTIKPS